MPEQRTLAAFYNVFLRIDLVRIKVSDFEPAVAKHILHFRPPIIAFLRFPQLKKCIGQALVHRPPIEKLVAELL
jgi:hypothetical protein